MSLFRAFIALFGGSLDEAKVTLADYDADPKAALEKLEAELKQIHQEVADQEPACQENYE